MCCAVVVDAVTGRAFVSYNADHTVTMADVSIRGRDCTTSSRPKAELMAFRQYASQMQARIDGSNKRLADDLRARYGSRI